MSSPFANASKATPGTKAGGKYEEFDEEDNTDTKTRPTTDKKDLEN